MIRAQVSWWPGNVSTKGGTHIHHMVFGIITIMVVGWFGVVNEDLGSPGREICAVLFGIGTGLTLDEYALWLNLKDVYWEKQGRASIDAVIIAASVAGLFLVGLRGWIDAADDVESVTKAVVAALGLLGIAIVVINAAKEKFGIRADQHPGARGRPDRRRTPRKAPLAVGAQAIARAKGCGPRSATPAKRRSRSGSGAAA